MTPPEGPSRQPLPVVAPRPAAGERGRFLRHALNFLSTLSLLLCLAACALWAWSYGDGRTLWHSRLWADGPAYRDRRLGINYWHGRILLRRMEGRYEPTPGREALFEQTWSQLWPRWFSLLERPVYGGVFTDPEWGFAGVEYQHTLLGGGTSRDVQHSLLVPLWLPAALFAILPAWRIAGQRQFLAVKRLRLGLCPACGYDLTGNVSGVCPECGAA